jgi:hypothetical protein
MRASIIELKAARRAGKIARENEEKIRARLTRRLDRLERRCADPPLLKMNSNGKARIKGATPCSSAISE